MAGRGMHAVSAVQRRLRAGSHAGTQRRGFPRLQQRQQQRRPGRTWRATLAGAQEVGSVRDAQVVVAMRVRHELHPHGQRAQHEQQPGRGVGLAGHALLGGGDSSKRAARRRRALLVQACRRPRLQAALRSNERARAQCRHACSVRARGRTCVQWMTRQGAASAALVLMPLSTSISSSVARTAAWAAAMARRHG